MHAVTSRLAAVTRRTPADASTATRDAVAPPTPDRLARAARPRGSSSTPRRPHGLQSCRRAAASPTAPVVQSPMSYMTPARHVIDVAVRVSMVCICTVENCRPEASHDDVARPSSRLATATRAGGRVRHVGGSNRGLRYEPTPQRWHLHGEITTDSGTQHSTPRPHRLSASSLWLKQLATSPLW